MSELYTIFYDPNRNIEKPPEILEKSDFLFKDKIKVSFFALNIKSIDDEKGLFEKWKTQLSEDVNAVNVFFHKPEQYGWLPKAIKGEKKLKLFISYSSTDPIYKEIWKRIHLAENCQYLISTLQFWIKNHIIDPIKLVKHRCLNLFSHISVDLQTLVTLIDEKDYGEVDKIAGEIRQSWEMEHSTHSPNQSLKKLWCYLLGNQLSGIKCDKYGLIYIGDEQKTLFEWLKEHSLQNNKDEYSLLGKAWENLVKICGLKALPKRSFAMNRESDIVKLCLRIEREITNPLIYQDELKEHAKDLAKWMESLSKCFEDINQEILFENEPELANHQL